MLINVIFILGWCSYQETTKYVIWIETQCYNATHSLKKNKQWRTLVAMNVKVSLKISMARASVIQSLTNLADKLTKGHHWSTLPAIWDQQDFCYIQDRYIRRCTHVGGIVQFKTLYKDLQVTFFFRYLNTDNGNDSDIITMLQIE